jgi:hypothetical protein
MRVMHHLLVKIGAPAATCIIFAISVEPPSACPVCATRIWLHTPWAARTILFFDLCRSLHGPTFVGCISASAHRRYVDIRLLLSSILTAVKPRSIYTTILVRGPSCVEKEFDALRSSLPEYATTLSGILHPGVSLLQTMWHSGIGALRRTVISQYLVKPFPITALIPRRSQCHTLLFSLAARWDDMFVPAISTLILQLMAQFLFYIVQDATFCLLERRQWLKANTGPDFYNGGWILADNSMVCLSRDIGIKQFTAAVPT